MDPAITTESEMPLDTEVSHSMQCMEVWGGNEAVQASVKLGGLHAWIYAAPYHGDNDGGGDVYYVSSCASGNITRLLLADVSGHGSAVAGVAKTLRQLMRSHVNNVNQINFIKQMNQQFTEQSDSGIFATAVVTTYYSLTSEMSLCNAGHPPPLVYHADQKSWHFLKLDQTDNKELANVPLGIIDIVDYEQVRTKLAADDLVLCYTDSLPECRDRSGRMLGLEGLLNIVSSIDPTTPNLFIPQLLKSLTIRCGGQVDGDDLTILLFRRETEGLQQSLTRSLFAPWRLLRLLGQTISSKFKSN